MSGYVYLRHLVELMIQHNDGMFFVELYLISLKGMDTAKLLDILLQLKGKNWEYCFPYMLF